VSEPETTDATAEERASLSALLVGLTRDASQFAQAEIAYLKAQAGERAHYAVPGLIMIGVALALGLGLLSALPIALIWLLTPLIGTGFAFAIVTLVGLAATALLVKLGVRRIKAVLKRPEDR
jgi:phosphate/sulfate permease